MRIVDPTNRVTEQGIAQLCQLSGLPRPERVDGGEIISAYMIYVLQFPKHSGVPTRWLRIDHMNHVLGKPIDHILVATNALRLAEGVPCRTDVKRVPDQVFRRPAALYSNGALTSGQKLCSLNHRFFQTAIADLANVLTSLEAHPVPHFGTKAANNRFSPTRQTWREEWQHYVYRLHHGAKKMGFDFGPLSEKLLTEIDARIDVLDEVRTFHVVHGELKLNDLQYYLHEGEPRLVNIEGFDRAIQGDHLIEVAYLLTYNPKLLGPILKAYGIERARAWMEEEHRRRIEVYLFTLALTRPSIVAHRVLELGQKGALSTLEYARILSAQVLEPGFVENKLSEALQWVDFENKSMPKPIQVSHSDTVLREALNVLRGSQSIPLAKVPLLSIALGMGALCAELGTEPTYEANLVQIAEQTVDLFTGLGMSLTTEPIENRNVWREQLVQDVLHSAHGASASAGSTALMLTWLGLSGIEKLAGTVSDSVLRGLEQIVREMAIHDEKTDSANPVLQLQHALLGRAAMVWLTDTVLGLDEDICNGLCARFDQHISTLVGSTDLALAPTSEFPLQTLLPMLIDGGASQEQRLTRPLLILAFQTLNGKVELPANARTLIGLMGG